MLLAINQRHNVIMILNVYKPAGMTSHDVVDAVRKIMGERRVGHGGTLDPFACGVLVVGVGRESTRRLEKILKGTEKEYVAFLELGKTSTTGDTEGEIKVESCKLKVEEKEIRETLKQFVGEIDQIPPAYSAIKIKGRPAYKLAREGKEFELPKRKITIYELEMFDYKPPFLRLRVVCSSGAYIRSLGADIGKALGTGAYVKELARTRVGEHKIEESVSLEELERKLKG